jgi:integrase
VLTPWCCLYLTLADAGLRPGEALARRYEDFDPISWTLHVMHAVSNAGAIKSTKPEAARDVDVTRRLADTLSALQASASASALASGIDPSPYIFPTSTGTFLEPRNVSRRLREIMTRQAPWGCGEWHVAILQRCLTGRWLAPPGPRWFVVCPIFEHRFSMAMTISALPDVANRLDLSVTP